MHFVFWLPLLGTPPSSTSHPSPDWTSRWQLHWYGNPGLINDPIIIGILRSIMGVINNPQKGNHLPARVYPLFDPPSEEKRAAVVGSSVRTENTYMYVLYLYDSNSQKLYVTHLRRLSDVRWCIDTHAAFLCGRSERRPFDLWAVSHRCQIRGWMDLSLEWAAELATSRTTTLLFRRSPN